MSKKSIVIGVLVASIFGLAMNEPVYAGDKMMMILGGGLAGLGGIIAATSSESVSARDPFSGFEIEASARNNSQLGLGLALAGGGVALMIVGAKQQEFAETEEPNKGPQFNFIAAPTKKGFWSGMSVRW